ncbi:SsrA-binding protein SmpB [Candidatus Methylomirabilis sp.]|uniref:SsrA-binding protein SmpB n=1 Tax=Candidatus Methylomirabilis sp. TaxID=2032687 RepID=UPI003076198A
MISARERKILCSNRRARHEYQIEEVIEAGIALTGTEVKSLREGKADLKDSHAAIETGEAYLVGCHISPYTAGNRFNPDPNRTRKLLLHREEVMRLMGKVQEKGLTLIPLSVYVVKRKIKVELALARGKKLYDKRETLKQRAITKEMAQLARGRADRARQ